MDHLLTQGTDSRPRPAGYVTHVMCGDSPVGIPHVKYTMAMVAVGRLLQVPAARGAQTREPGRGLWEWWGAGGEARFCPAAGEGWVSALWARPLCRRRTTGWSASTAVGLSPPSTPPGSAVPPPATTSVCLAPPLAARRTNLAFSTT